MAKSESGSQDRKSVTQHIPSCSSRPSVEVKVFVAYVFFAGYRHSICFHVCSEVLVIVAWVFHISLSLGNPLGMIH